MLPVAQYASLAKSLCMTYTAKIIGWSGCLLASFLQEVVAQSIRFKTPNTYQLEAGTFLSTSSSTPFWLRANQYGVVPLKSSAATLRGGFVADYDTARTNHRRFDYGYGLNAVTNAGPKSPAEHSAYLMEAYAKVRFGIFELYGGRRRELVGLVDSTLSSGSYSWSGNALPIPKIQLAIPQFTPIGFTKGWLSVMGQYAHGWLDPTGYVSHTFLHQKSLYFRLGKPEHTVRLFAGFNHQVVWGGRSPELVKTGLSKTEALPHSLKDYFYVVTGRGGDAGDTTQYTAFDITNRVGNHLGTIDLAAEIDLSTYTLFFYRQNVYEDGSLFYLINIADGLNGIRLRRNNPDALVRDVLVEFLNTTSQGGNEFIISDNKKRGRDNYFNNAQFRDGWSYQHKTIGTPFITPEIFSNGQYPFGNFTNNNRVYAFHFGMSGAFPNPGWGWLDGRIRYQSKFSFSRNLGYYLAPETRKDQFSGWINVVAPLRLLAGTALTGSVALDTGQLYANSLGVYLGVRKTWSNR